MRFSWMMDASHPPRLAALAGMDLPPERMQVWLARLDCAPAVLTGCYALLAADEQARAARFYFESARQNFIVCRALLRLILGAYLQIEPARLVFDYGRQGKPALCPGLVDETIEFNLSHTDGLGVFAFSRGTPIGVDVESIRPMSDEDRFAELNFTAEEIAWIAAHSGAAKRAEFFKIWTCKEAFFKASGDGLAAPINQTGVDLRDWPSARLTVINGSREQAAGWKIVPFAPAPAYQAALAFEGPDWPVDMRWLSV